MILYTTRMYTILLAGEQAPLLLFVCLPRCCKQLSIDLRQCCLKSVVCLQKRCPPRATLSKLYTSTKPLAIRLHVSAAALLKVSCSTMTAAIDDELLSALRSSSNPIYLVYAMCISSSSAAVASSSLCSSVYGCHFFSAQQRRQSYNCGAICPL
jgi:hypothetical protein